MDEQELNDLRQENQRMKKVLEAIAYYDEYDLAFELDLINKENPPPPDYVVNILAAWALESLMSEQNERREG